MAEEGGGQSLLDHLRRVPDPRRREGRIYPLAGVLAILILAAIHGESSLRGMWIWAKAREEELVEEKALGLWGAGRLPALSAVWYILRKLDGKALEEAIVVWARGWGRAEVLSVDGKVLRGSKREGKPALQVVTVAAQVVQRVLKQKEVPEGNLIAAAMELLQEIPLEGRIVSLDAGLLQRKVAETIVEKKGPTSG